jgi:hypothetical protein
VVLAILGGAVILSLLRPVPRVKRG